MRVSSGAAPLSLSGAIAGVGWGGVEWTRHGGKQHKQIKKKKKGGERNGPRRNVVVRKKGTELMSG